jgi:hypothetical protein
MRGMLIPVGLNELFGCVYRLTQIVFDYVRFTFLVKAKAGGLL